MGENMTIQKDIIGDRTTYYVIQEEWLLEKKYAVLYRLSTGRYQHILIRVTDRKKGEFCYATDISSHLLNFSEIVTNYRQHARRGNCNWSEVLNALELQSKQEFLEKFLIYTYGV